MLSEGGVTVARRTVAKYREAMKIPSSSDRKRSRSVS
jgi:RNA polymerase sigma-54 factor